jgi:hypothetical protein
MMKTLRDTRRQLLELYPVLKDVMRIRRSAAAFEFAFIVHGLEPCLGPGCKLCARRVPKDLAQGVRLWRTDLVIKYPNGATRIDTGGWHSVSTSKYMGIALRDTPFSVVSRRGKWLVVCNDCSMQMSDVDSLGTAWRCIYEDAPLEDGMIL